MGHGVSLQEFDARVAGIVASQIGSSETEVTEALAQARGLLGGAKSSAPSSVDAGGRDRGSRRECLDDLVGKVQKRFAGKLQLGSELESRSELEGELVLLPRPSGTRAELRLPRH